MAFAAVVHRAACPRFVRPVDSFALPVRLPYRFVCLALDVIRQPSALAKRF
ncbi:MAG: hypothetical protein ACK6D3_12760 [Planctomycetaceae bacterium]